MTEPVTPVINDLSELIRKARNGFSSEGRTQWYPRLPKIVLDGIDFLEVGYDDLLLSCEKKFRSDVNAYEMERKIRGVPVDLRSKLGKGKLDRPGVEKVYDIITILSFRYRIGSEDVYLLEPLVYHLAAAVRRIDACYCTCSDMIRKSNWYITATMLEHRVKIFSFQDLVEVVMPATYRSLMAIKALTDEFLNHIFVGLFFSLLPREHSYRILDCFLLEGGKILYRYGIALISMFKAEIKADKFRTGEAFWAYVAAFCHSEYFDSEELHALAFDKKDQSFLKVLSRKRKINRRNISELKSQIRDPLEKSMALTKNSTGSIKLSTDICILAAVSTWFDRVLWSQSSILDTTMAIKLQLYLTEAMQLYPIKRDKGSERRKERGKIGTSSHKLSIPRPLPSVHDMRLVFSSALHGRSLSTLYDMVAGHYPCALLIRSLHKQAVVGVYISCSIAPCHRAGSFSQRGDLSCSCFRLNSVTISTGASSSVSLNTVSLFKSALARKLPVKISSLTGSDTEEEETSLAAGADGILGETDDSVNRINESDNDKGAQKASSKDFRISPRTVTSMNNEHYTMDTYVEQVKTNYISGDASVLMFGATASRQPLNAIRLDRELRMCHTAPSETFGNPNLVPEECSPFPVDIVEVYAGMFIDEDVDLSLLSEVDGKDRYVLKSERSGRLSTVSSSLQGAVANPLRHVEAAREREDATAQAQESYTYALNGRESCVTRAGILESSKSSQRTKAGGERYVDNDCDCDDDEIDRPWVDDDPVDSILEEKLSSSCDPHLQPLLLTPANLGCMPAIDEDSVERPKPVEAPILAAPRKPREQGWVDEEKGSSLSRGKGRKGNAFEEETGMGNHHFVMQYMHANNKHLGLGLSNKGGYRSGNGRIEISPIPGPDRHDSNRDGYRSNSRAERSTEEIDGVDSANWDPSNNLNYEAAGYRTDMNFSGTNSMVACPHSAAHSRLDSHYVTTPEPDSSSYFPKSSGRLFHS